MARYGEIGLKGKNRYVFENVLIKRMKEALSGLPMTGIHRTYGRLYVTMENGQELEPALKRLSRVFGLVSVSPAISASLDLEAIEKVAVRSMRDAANLGNTTFKVETRRPNKAYPHKSPEVSRIIGAAVLQQVPSFKVDVHAPEVTLNIEIREDSAYLYWRELAAPGGLPIGVSGRSVLLLSGGIDSPVAGWMAMSRGLELVAVYFHSFPFTSDRAKEKVIDLCQSLARYAGAIKLYVIPFTEIQTTLRQGGPDELQTILLRRMMMRLAAKVAAKEDAGALITGESLGQVASQTLLSLAATSAVVDIPVLRPLIGLDKQEIIRRAREIKSYDISIRPYPDCCTVFVPRHPETHPDKDIVAHVEEGLIDDKLLLEAIDKAETVSITTDWEGS